MPDEAQEDRAITLLLQHFESQGRSAQLLGRPDRDQESWPKLTCDAVVRSDGEEVAVDVVRATWTQEEMNAIGHWGKEDGECSGASSESQRPILRG